MREILLHQGTKAIVDDEDFERLSGCKWYQNTLGYATRYFDHHAKRKAVAMHREVLGLKKGDRRVVDHINGNRLDNRKANLRFCTVAQNAFNRGRSRNNTSGFKGVSYDLRWNRWCAFIRANGKSKNLGRYATPEEAHEVYCLWADMLHGEFANHGVE